jgi:hypothetical protein
MSMSLAISLNRWLISMSAGESWVRSLISSSVAFPLTSVSIAVTFKPRCGAERNTIVLTGRRDGFLPRGLE